MIYPKTNRFIFCLFHYYLMGLIRRNFKAVNFNAIEVDPGKSVLLIANHFSWWDAFLLYYVDVKLFKKKLYVMVLEDNIKKHWILKYVGAFSVNKTSRDVVNSLNYAADLLNDPANMVLIFPQGKIYSNFAEDVFFEKGVSRVVKTARGKFRLIFAVCFIENFQHKKPTVNVYLRDERESGFEDTGKLTNLYNKHYHAARARQTQIVI